MNIQAAEISAILKQQIANFGASAEVAEVGQVLMVGDGIARVYGLDQVQAGEMVEFPGGIKTRCSPSSRWMATAILGPSDMRIRTTPDSSRSRRGDAPNDREAGP